MAAPIDGPAVLAELRNVQSQNDSYHKSQDDRFNRIETDYKSGLQNLQTQNNRIETDFKLGLQSVQNQNNAQRQSQDDRFNKIETDYKAGLQNAQNQSNKIEADYKAGLQNAQNQNDAYHKSQDDRFNKIETDFTTEKVKNDKLNLIQDSRLTMLQTLLTNTERRFMTVFNRLRKIPDELLIRTKTATDSIADKIDDYRKVMKGEKGDNTAKDEMFIIKEKHAVLLNKLRKENPLFYCVLVQSSDVILPESLLSQNLPYLKCNPELIQNPISLQDPKQQTIFVCNLLLLNSKSVDITSKILQALKTKVDIFPSDQQMDQWLSANS